MTHHATRAPKTEPDHVERASSANSNGAARVQWYDRGNIAECVWPQTTHATLIYNYWRPFIEEGAEVFIQNVHTQPLLIRVDDVCLPITVNDQGDRSCYVCSPYGHYITYAIEELRELNYKSLEWLLAIILNLLGLLLKWGAINRVVHVNNLLLSTNLYPDLTDDQLDAILDSIRHRFPRHSIVFRSLNQRTCSQLIRQVTMRRASLIVSRQVYIFPDLSLAKLKPDQRRAIRRDKQLFQSNHYEIVAAEHFSAQDVEREVSTISCISINTHRSILSLHLAGRS